IMSGYSATSTVAARHLGCVLVTQSFLSAFPAFGLLTPQTADILTYLPAPPSPTTTNGAQNAASASYTSPVSTNASIESRMASARRTVVSDAILLIVPVISLTGGSDATAQCDTSSAREPA